MTLWRWVGSVLERERGERESSGWGVRWRLFRSVVEFGEGVEGVESGGVTVESGGCGRGERWRENIERSGVTGKKAEKRMKEGE